MGAGSHAIGELFVQLVGLIFLWLLATAIAIRYAYTWQGAIVALMVGLSLPTYYFHHQYQSRRNAEQRQHENLAWIEQQEREFARRCEAVPPLEVIDRRPGTRTADVRFFGLWRIDRPGTGKPESLVCWQASKAECGWPNIRSVEIYPGANIPACALEYPQSETCAISTFRTRGDGKWESLEKPGTVRYAFEIEEKSYVGAFAPYVLRLVDLSDGSELAKARMLAFHIPHSGKPNEDSISRYCPLREDLISRMMQEAFPKPPDDAAKTPPRIRSKAATK